MPTFPGEFFVPCIECGDQVKVSPGTFQRVLRGGAVIVCQECLPTQTYCSELHDERQRNGAAGGHGASPMGSGPSAAD